MFSQDLKFFKQPIFKTTQVALKKTTIATGTQPQQSHLID